MGFPHSTRTQSALEKPLGSTYYRLQPERDDVHLNPYNPVVSMAWLANIDIAPWTGTEVLLNYLSKYVSKSERHTQSNLDPMRGVLPRINTQIPLLSALRKLLNALLSQRDWSAQEVLQILLGIPLHYKSWTVIPVQCRPQTEQATIYNAEPDADIRPRKSLLATHQDRPAE